MDMPRAPKFLPLICYEIIFPGEGVPRGERPGWLINVTNDAWFGVSTVYRRSTGPTSTCSAATKPGREGFVTLIANYQPLQDPYGGPNYFPLNPEAAYDIHIV